MDPHSCVPCVIKSIGQSPTCLAGGTYNGHTHQAPCSSIGISERPSGLQVALSATMLHHLVRLESGQSLPTETDQPTNPEPSVPSSNSQEEVVYVKEASVGDAFLRGDPEAPVTIIEFSDFQCPFCNQSYSVLKQLLENYNGKIKLAYRHYPLAIHEHAYLAALAAEAAGEQGKFWEMHDFLFERVAKEGPTALTRNRLVSYARQLGLDIERFTAALDQEKYGPKVTRDFEDGERYGVTGTPTFFINGRKVVGARSYEELSRIVEEELRKVGADVKRQ